MNRKITGKGSFTTSVRARTATLTKKAVKRTTTMMTHTTTKRAALRPNTLLMEDSERKCGSETQRVTFTARFKAKTSSRG